MLPLASEVKCSVLGWVPYGNLDWTMSWLGIIEPPASERR